MTCYIFSLIFPYHIIEKVHIIVPRSAYLCYELNSANFSLKKEKKTELQNRIPLATPPKPISQNPKVVKKCKKKFFNDVLHFPHLT